MKKTALALAAAIMLTGCASTTTTEATTKAAEGNSQATAQSSLKETAESASTETSSSETPSSENESSMEKDLGDKGKFWMATIDWSQYSADQEVSFIDGKYNLKDFNADNEIAMLTEICNSYAFSTYTDAFVKDHEDMKNELVYFGKNESFDMNFALSSPCKDLKYLAIGHNESKNGDLSETALYLKVNPEMEAIASKTYDFSDSRLSDGDTFEDCIREKGSYLELDKNLYIDFNYFNGNQVPFLPVPAGSDDDDLLKALLDSYGLPDLTLVNSEKESQQVIFEYIRGDHAVLATATYKQQSDGSLRTKTDYMYILDSKYLEKDRDTSCGIMYADAINKPSLYTVFTPEDLLK